MRFLPPLFISCCLWGITNGTTWKGRFEESRITLSAGNTINVILDRDPSVDSNRGNNFGFDGGTNLALSSSGGNASLILAKASNLSDIQFYHNGGNTISVSNNAQLTISLGNHNRSRNTFLLAGGLIEVNSGGSFALNGAYILKIGSDGGRLVINQNGEVEISSVTEIKVTTKKGKQSGIINNGGNIVLKAEYGVFNSSFNTDPYFPLGSSDGAGVITHNSGTTTIRHREDGKESRFYNAGYGDFGTRTSKNRHALLEVNGGTFNVVGNLYNGGKDGGSGGAGVGWIVGRGGTINVSNTLYNYSLDPSLPSKIDLENSTIQAKTLLNRANGEIYLKDKAHIEATTFTSDANSKVVFVGKGDGFGSITATQNIALDGKEIFQAELLNTTPNYKYLIISSPSITGIQTGIITLQDSQGNISNRYTAELIQENDNFYIQLTPTGIVAPPTPNNPTDYISNSHSIQTELTKQYYILTQATLEQTTQTILSQIEQIQSLKNITTYALSNLYNRFIQYQIKPPTPHLAYNPYTPSTQSDFLPTPLLEGRKNYSAFINFIGGAFGYESNIGGNYGASFGIDGFIGDSLFLGGYGVVLGKTLNQEGLTSQGVQAEFGSYARYLLSSWEFDTTLSYALLHNSTQRDFTLYSNTFSQNATYNTHFFDLQERIGYGFALTSTDTLKPYGGVGLNLYFQPSYQESGDFSTSQDSLFYGSLSLSVGLEYRKIFNTSSLYLGSSLSYQIPIMGDKTYSIRFLDSLLYFENPSILTAQVQGGMDFSLTPSSFLSVELNYQYSDTKYFDVNGILGYRHLF